MNYIIFGGAPLRGNESETVIGIVIAQPDEGVQWLIVRTEIHVLLYVTNDILT